MKKRILGFPLIFTLLTALLASPSFGSQSNSWIPVDALANEPTYHSVTFEDYLPLQFNYSVLTTSDEEGSMVCKSTSDPSCATKPLFQYNSIYKVCESNADTDCIEALNAINDKGQVTAAKFSRYTVTNHLNAFPADANFKIPAGSMPSIWNIPSLPHEGGSDYAVVAGENGEVELSGKESEKLGRYTQVSLVPVVLKDFGKGPESQTGGWERKLIDGVYYDYCTTSVKVQGQRFMDCGHVFDKDCFLPTNEQGLCYQQVAFVGSPKINIKLRLSKEPNGWIHGRITDPDVSITKASGSNISLSITAGTTSVPNVYQGGLWASLPTDLKNFWVDCFKTNYLLCGNTSYRGSNASIDWNILSRTLEGQAQINSNVTPYSFGDRALAAMAAIAPLIGDKANASKTSWSFRTLTNNEMQGANKCITSTPGIKGIVSTNSTTYSAGPPVLKNGFLEYKVASAHYLPDGTTPFKGNYNLVMRSDVARCIYGFSSAPISASISVVSSEGNTNVATSVTSEKNGWIALRADNFEFSAPVIQVKFEQKKTLSKQSITCLKGKLRKVVTSTNPKCPSGYKKS